MADDITFSEYPTGTANPTYTFTDNTVSVTGEIVTDAGDPTSPAVAANTSFNGPVSFALSNPISTASLDAGVFDNLESTQVEFIGTDGQVLASFKNEELGYEHFSYQAPDGTAISSITVSPVASDTNGFSVDNLSIGNPVCFVTGTLILTERGDVAVETLRSGDIVVTASGARRPIRWLGHRNMDFRAHPHPHEALPVRIATHAFGENRPNRDLFVSPGHSLCLDVLGEVLIPAAALVNGSTISQVEVDTVTYWHVELDSHDILVANGLPAESYLEMSNRSFFVENDIVAWGASPDAKPSTRTHDDFCRPYHDGGALVRAVRTKLAAQAKALRTPSNQSRAA